MSKYFKLSSLCALVLIVTLSLTACTEDLLKSGQAQLSLESENRSLKNELASLQSQLEAREGEIASRPETATAGESSRERETGQPVEIIRSPEKNREPQEGEFVYKGNLEINGKKVRDMSRAEMEALPTITSTIKFDDGRVEEIVAPSGVKNLYEQLRYVDNLNRLVLNKGEIADKIIQEEPLKPGVYDISDKSLVVHRNKSNGMHYIYEISAVQKSELSSWMDKHLTKKVAGNYEDSLFDTCLFVSDEDILLFTEADFLAPGDKKYGELRDLTGDIYQVNLQGEGAGEMREILQDARLNPIFDEEDVYAKNKEDLPTFSLNVSFAEYPSSDKCIIRVKNKDDVTWLFRNSYSLSYYDGKEWRHMQPTKAGDCFLSRNYVLEPDQEREFELDYESCYDSLPIGYYRINVAFVPKSATEQTGNTHSYTDKELYSMYFVIQ